LSEERVERRLAAILAADVAGYSRLIEASEEGTLGRLKALRAEIIDPKIARHKGRIVKTTGDGLLVEFASVVDALRSAAEMQAVLAESNAPIPPERRIQFRIGINVGDIVVEGGDIFGDGVNVAARLEALAEPGGICVSARVQEDAAGRLNLTFEDMGDQALKNIARPVRVYRVRPEGPLPSPPLPGLDQGITGEGSARSAHVGAAEPLPLPDKPSIAVLPFANMSGDPEQEYFADGMVEEIITALSRIRWLFVIARNSSFTYKGKVIDAKQVGRELGVRYVLEGSVRKGGNQVRSGSGPGRREGLNFAYQRRSGARGSSPRAISPRLPSAPVADRQLHLSERPNGGPQAARSLLGRARPAVAALEARPVGI
jgi:adenylate cyclase